MSQFDLLNAPPVPTVAAVALSRLRLAYASLAAAGDAKSVLFINPHWIVAKDELNTLIAQAEQDLKLETKKQNALVQ